MRNKSISFALSILIITLISCEKEVEPGNMIFSSVYPISNIFWTESSNEILYITEDFNLMIGFTVSINFVDISTKVSRKAIDIQNQSGYQIYLNNNKIYYTDCLDPDNIKLYSVDISGQNNELVNDSMCHNLHLSKKYMAYLKDPYTTSTTALFDLETGSERIIAPGSVSFPLSISPDGNWLMMAISENTDGIPLLINTTTGDITDLMLSYHSSYCGYFWRDDEVYTMWSVSEMECNIENMRTGEILISTKELQSECSCTFTFSPSGQYIYYVNEIRNNDYEIEKLYLNIINTYTLERTEIDMGNKSIFLIKFSPDESRIAFIRDDYDIYILNL